MFKNYLTIAWRNLLKNRTSSFINISGLAVGMTVATLIGLWIRDEFSFNKNFDNHDRIAQVMQHQVSNGNISTFNAIPLPLGEELRRNYGNNFKYIVMASWEGDHILSAGEKNFSRIGMYMDEEGPRMFSLHMKAGSIDGLNKMNAVLIDASTARVMFGNVDPINQVVRMDNKFNLTVAGIYDDLPHNTEFGNLNFIAPWSLYRTSETWIKQDVDQWDNNSFQLFVQTADQTSFQTAGKNIAQVKYNHDAPADKKVKAELF